MLSSFGPGRLPPVGPGRGCCRCRFRCPCWCHACVQALQLRHLRETRQRGSWWPSMHVHRKHRVLMTARCLSENSPATLLYSLHTATPRHDSFRESRNHMLGSLAACRARLPCAVPEPIVLNEPKRTYRNQHDGSIITLQAWSTQPLPAWRLHAQPPAAPRSLPPCTADGWLRFQAACLHHAPQDYCTCSSRPCQLLRLTLLQQPAVEACRWRVWRLRALAPVPQRSRPARRGAPLAALQHCPHARIHVRTRIDCLGTTGPVPLLRLVLLQRHA
jgi:hypothetical protein